MVVILHLFTTVARRHQVVVNKPRHVTDRSYNGFSPTFAQIVLNERAQTLPPT